jgi:DNA topoisomerase I
MGAHPQDGKPILVMEGKYGAYVKHGKTNATLPKDTDVQKVTMEEVVALLAERSGKSGKKAPAKKAAAPKKAAEADKKPAKKAAAKKPAAKKPAAKKAAAKKPVAKKPVSKAKSRTAELAD